MAKAKPEDEDDITIMGTSELFSDRQYTYVQYNADEYGFFKIFHGFRHKRKQGIQNKPFGRNGG
ncbi:MAG: hypothetical protein L6V93_15340 [Clostridiales bacterium]|nr:MAG: hypothetical protein L6V93_15340 [Clostridiales bacterium]